MVASIGITRRNILYVATSVVGAVGLGLAVWPLIDQMNPDASVVAAGDFVEIDLSRLGHPAMTRWHSLPIVVAKRTPDILKMLQDPKRVTRLVDPDSHEDQQPAYAKNWHRSLRPEWSVLVGVCTYCGCATRYLSGDDAVAFGADGAGGHFCPCCASKYDLAGRAYLGAIARHNLPVPPHSFVDGKTLRIGQNPPGEIFFFESIKQI